MTDSSDSGSSSSSPPPPPPKKKKATGGGDGGSGRGEGGVANQRLSVERIYQKKTQLEHILLRPDTYIGSVEPVTQNMWVYDGEEAGLVLREVTFVPGLYKIFDEILVNAADNKQRCSMMDSIKVDIDSARNTIEICNNGKGIPIVEHKVEKMFVPSLIFGHLLTSSNYNDEEKKVTGGRNGYGAKLCNIFSTKFTVETACKESGKCFKQTWQNNMANASEPITKSFKGADYTLIRFSPDLSKFGMKELDRDIVAIMSKRAYDVAGSTRGIKVFLNGKKLPVKGFKDYVDLIVKNKSDEDGNPVKILYEAVNARWEVAATTSEKGFQQVSFVNSIATTKGGRHVDYVVDQIVAKIVETVKKKTTKSGIQVKPFQVKNHLWVFVNCLIENPTFDSQTKENMTLQMKSFGSKCVLSEKFVKSVEKGGLIDAVMTWVQFKTQTQLNKKCSARTLSKLKGMPKLEDANNAGTKHGIGCTLILTEGDSAKTLAVSGLGVVGRDKYGVFPLRGKILNVRDAHNKQILENAEINNIIKIMGLQYRKKYESSADLQTLRYGRLMIMTDQDQDGSHIKGLLINFVHSNWPGLLRFSFLEEFITPIVKVKRGSRELAFYSLPEFEEWKHNTEDWNKWTTKYYKGLGTSTAMEARNYFKDMNRHRICFKYQGMADDNAIKMAFSKKAAEQRKEWLTNGMEERKRRRELGLPELYLYGKDTKEVTYHDFVNKELILFSNMDNERSIPSLVDGLKPGSRKVIFTCMKRNIVREIKVAQLAGSVSELSAYHHGEVSLMSTIINLAQNFVGSNNLNLLVPIGQFGTRLQGGKDAASARYIFTKLSPLLRHVFNKLDENVLTFLREDNQRIEPEYYVPIIPMILVNGADGIGTGWMTKIPNYDIRELVANVKRMIAGEEPLPMMPSFKNFRGTIEQLDNYRYVVNGEVAIINDSTIEITELPVRVWTQTYKENVLEVMLHGTEKKAPSSIITDYKEYHTDTTVRFVVSMPEAKLAAAEGEGLHKTFKLQGSFSNSSMVLFDRNGCLKKYETVEDILKEFYVVRLEYYVKRKSFYEGMLAAESQKLDNQARFILEKIRGELVLEDRKRQTIINELVQRKYDPDPVKRWMTTHKEDVLLEEAEEGEESQADDAEPAMEAASQTKTSDYDYLMMLHMWHLSNERKEQLLKERDAKKVELEILKKKQPHELWLVDLDKFLVELDRVEQKEREEEMDSGSSSKSKKGLGKSAGAASSKGRKLAIEALPSPAARRIVPHIDPELRKKTEKTAATGETKRGRKKKSESQDSSALSDGEAKPLAERLKTKDAMVATKQPKAAKDRKPADPAKKAAKKQQSRNPWSEDESDVDDVSSISGFQSSSSSDAVGPVNGNVDSSAGSAAAPGKAMSPAIARDVVDSDSDVSQEAAKSPSALFDSLLEDNDAATSAPALPPPPKTTTTAKITTEDYEPAVASRDHGISLDSDSESDVPQPIVRKRVKESKAVTKKPSAAVKKRVRKRSSSDSVSSGGRLPKSKKPATKAKRPAATLKTKRPAMTDSDSDADAFVTQPTKLDADSVRSRPGRSRAPVKYDFGAESEDSDY